MIHAYEEIYLNDAQNTLGDMMDYAVLDCGYEPDAFFLLFLASRLADEFGSGNSKYIAGLSGPELAREVVSRVGGQDLTVPPSEGADKSPIYWAGWALAYYQWHSGHCFAFLHKVLPFTKLLSLYPALHEADIQKFAALADNLVLSYASNSETNLACIRKANGLSQKQLAENSGVALRMIQLYEQKQNDINKAQLRTLLALSKTLSCPVEALAEPLL